MATHEKGLIFLVELEMKEWIRRIETKYIPSGCRITPPFYQPIKAIPITECPYCHYVFKQVVNSKWCPACDRAVRLTKGLPYSNYIPNSPQEHKHLKDRKRFISKEMDKGVDIFEKDSHLI